MTIIGYGSLLLACGVSAYAALALAWGANQGAVAWRQSGRNAILSAAALVTVAVAALLYLLFARDFSVLYVYSHTSTRQALPYTLSALWAGQEGSLLLWLWFVSLLAALVAQSPRLASPATWRYTQAALAVLQAFLALILVTQSNPFASLAPPPAEGLGLNPLLENPWMVVHPPLVFASYALYSVPCALALAGLLTGHQDAAFHRTLQRWNLWAWLFLGGGILLGSLWAYLELGWGGYWGWDPVENASLVPWLTGTAALHTAIAHRGLRQKWTAPLTIVTFLLCLFAAFVTRSGVIQSVHAFGRSSVGIMFLAFIGLVAILAAFLGWRNRAQVVQEAEASLLSRETGLSFTAMILCGLALVILAGTLYAPLSESLRGAAVVLGASFYTRASAPLLVALLALLGVCPLLRWRDTSARQLGRELAAPLAFSVILVILLFALGIREPAALVLYLIASLIGAVILWQFGQEAWRRRDEGLSPWQVIGRAFRARRRHHGAHLVHLGIALIAIAIVSSSLYQTEQLLTLREGQGANLPGYTLILRDTIQEQDATRQRNAALLELQSATGRHLAYLTPERNLHWSIQQWVTEVALHINLREDIYIILGSLEQDGAVVLQVLRNPLVVWLWIGGGLLLLGAAIVLSSAPPERAGQAAGGVAEEAP